MLQEILYSIVGDWGEAAIKWMLANPLIVGAALLMWMGSLAAGKYQVQRLKSRTESLVLEAAQQWRAAGRGLGAKDLYRNLYPEWSAMVRHSALFIPHRWELWPVPASPTRVEERIGFSPEWIHDFLTEQGFSVHGARGKAGQQPAQAAAQRPARRK
jgi:hypothetical protein